MEQCVIRLDDQKKLDTATLRMEVASAKNGFKSNRESVTATAHMLDGSFACTSVDLPDFDLLSHAVKLTESPCDHMFFQSRICDTLKFDVSLSLV